MNQIKAIGFDLVNTLVSIEASTLHEAFERLVRSLEENGLCVSYERFKKVYREEAVRFLSEAHQNGKETHNRFWVSKALEGEGHAVAPHDERIAAAVESYFSAFPERSRLIPGTLEMLETLRGTYRLGLLSNFTHAPAAWAIIDYVRLTPFFDVILISGDLGYRKPHPFVFRRLTESLGAPAEAVMFVGDDPEPDIVGAQQAGLQPVWTTCVRDQNLDASKGMVTGASSEPDSKVPRISNWEGFLSMLGA